MDLIVNNYLINAPIIEILKKLKSELSNGKLQRIVPKGDDVRVTCPFHKDGVERHESCGVYSGDSDEIMYGNFHCFTCGESGPLWHFIAGCLDKSDDFGKQWLIERFGTLYVNRALNLQEIELSNQSHIKTLDASKLQEMQNFHPYMIQRKLSPEICEKFSVKYDTVSKCLVFPVWDEKNNLVMLTRRSVFNKFFIIDEDAEKPIYLLNYIKMNNIKKVLVCESQINCLYAWSLGFPAIALFGTGTKYQYEILNKSGIRHYVLCFDGDTAGDKGTERFKNNIRKDVFIDVVKVPRGKDLNDLSEEDARKLLTI